MGQDALAGRIEEGIFELISPGVPHFRSKLPSHELLPIPHDVLLIS